MANIVEILCAASSLLDRSFLFGEEVKRERENNDRNVLLSLSGRPITVIQTPIKHTTARIRYSLFVVNDVCRCIRSRIDIRPHVLDGPTAIISRQAR